MCLSSSNASSEFLGFRSEGRPSVWVESQTELIHPNIGTNWLSEVKMRHVNDFYRVEQLHLLKLKAYLNFESSTHSIVVKWPVEFGFIVGSHYVQVYPLANQIYVDTCK